jgi:hypothetical protein
LRFEQRVKPGQGLRGSAQVRKGEKAMLAVFWRFANSAGETQDDGSETSASGSRLLFTRG